MSVLEYNGRTSDVAAFHGTGINVDRLLSQTLGTPDAPGGELVTGIVKLAQRFLMLLLTEQGSLRYAPNLGCRFMRDARFGGWRTSADVVQSFSFSLVDVRRQLVLMQLPTDPPDEQYASVTVLGITLNPVDRASLRLNLTSQAGTSRVFIAPLRVTAG